MAAHCRNAEADDCCLASMVRGRYASCRGAGSHRRDQVRTAAGETIFVVIPLGLPIRTSTRLRAVNSALRHLPTRIDGTTYTDSLEMRGLEGARSLRCRTCPWRRLSRIG